MKGMWNVVTETIWMITVGIFTVITFYLYYLRRRKAERAYLEKGYSKINKDTAFQIAREFMGQEYEGLLDNFFIERKKRGWMTAFFFPARMYIRTTGRYKGWQIEYRYLIDPVINDDEGRTLYTGYVGHQFFIKYPSRKKFLISKAEKLICTDLVHIPTKGTARFYAIMDMEEKLEFRELLEKTFLLKDEFIKIMDGISTILEKHRAGEDIADMSVSGFFPERFKVIRVEDGLLRKLSGYTRAIVEMELIDPDTGDNIQPRSS